MEAQYATLAKQTTEPVVILVDNRRRDLDVAALIAHHLGRLGIACHLEPLEAFRGVVGAYRPGMIVFNHLNASHLAEWSRRLAEIGVLVAVLPNEGFVYEKEARPFMSGHFHQPHVDHFFCWNEQHRNALIEEGADRSSVHTVGVPRFDFYFKPWSQNLPPAPPRLSNRPRILFCTNFILAKMRDRMEDADRLFAGKQRTISFVRDYRGAVESQWRSRARVLEYLETVIDDGRFDVLLRPHPSEDANYYQSWLVGLSEARRLRIQFEPTGGIAPLILDCDLEISCESCTTAVESWIVGKPTIELVFDKHPMLYRASHASLNFPCSEPSALPEMIARHLATPEQAEKHEQRAQHLADWCATPDGRSSEKIARIIVEAVCNKRPSDWSKLGLNDYRRATKLLGLRKLGLAYHFDPLLWLKRSLFPARYAVKDRGYRKSIRPSDVIRAQRRLNQVRMDGH
jgi:surface carbohydrate biosynthesis protein